MRLILSGLLAMLPLLAGPAALPGTASAQPAPAPTTAAPATPGATAQPAVGAPTIDDIAATERGVVRVVVVAVSNGQVMGFGHGSGFAITPTRIITNAHVVEDAASYPDNVIIGIVPSEGSRSYAARLVRIDRRRDLAIVEIARGRVPPISLFSGQVAPRQQVYALGYPGNVDLATAQGMDAYIQPRRPIASDGIVSATDRINNTEALIHDADIARGNSGGPLVDACGRVLGVNSFISRADEGDSPFAFAVTVRELATFLKDSGQDFTATATPCISASEAAARDAARTSAEQQRQADADARTAAQREAEDAQTLEQMRADALNRRDNFMALSFLLFGIAILCGSASFMYQVQNRPREQRAAIMGGGLLAVGSIILFLLRPNPADVHLERPATQPPKATAETPAPLYGELSCIIDRNRGRITVSAGEDPSFAITPEGCVNGKTQYVVGAGGTWSRTLVPQEDATITHIRYDPVRRETTAHRYLLSLEDMEAIRRQRSVPPAAACTADPAALEALATRERTIAAMLPATANEEIISRCSLRAGASKAASTPARPAP